MSIIRFLQWCHEERLLAMISIIRCWIRPWDYLEDDVLVTARGHRILSASLPMEPDKVDARVRQIRERRDQVSRPVSTLL